VPTTHVPTTAVPATITPTRTTTETLTPTLTMTPTHTVTPTLVETPTLTPTQTPTVTETVTPTATETETLIPTPTETETPTPTSTETETPTPTSTETETPTPTSTETGTPTPTVTLVSTVISFSADFKDDDTVQDNTLDLVSVDEDGGNFQKILANNEEMLLGDWSPDGAKIVFEIHSTGGVQRLYTANANGTSKTLIANQPDGKNNEPQWSPDGEWIVHVNRDPSRSGGAANLWLIPTGGGPSIALTSGMQEDTQPSWAPDGNTIVFVRNTEIYKLDVKEIYYESDASPQALLKSFLGLFSSNVKTSIEITTVPQPLLDGSPTVLGDWPRYSPDGKYLLLVREGKLIRLNLSTKAELDLTDGMPAGTARTPSWSPDGRKIAFIFHTNGESSRDEVWLVSSTGEHREKLELPAELVEKHRPIWKP
jgi:Tol biopolymer transport system component